MALTDGIALLAAAGIFGFIWVRTKVLYRSLGSPLRVTRMGWQYFGAALVLMGIGAVVAPGLTPLLGVSGTVPLPALPTVMRVLWFLGTYYLFIGVHHLVKARGTGVFTAANRADETG